MHGGVHGVTLPQELQAARLRLVKERPYLASAAWAMQPVQKPGLGTLAVDMYWRLYYDPVALTLWPVEIISGALYHEICHLLRNHPERMRNFDPRLSNIAADAEINDDLLREGVQLPAQPITPQSIGQSDNLLAEEYYFALETRSHGSHNPHADEDNQDDDKNDKKEVGGGRSDISKCSEDYPMPGAGRCGSCATGQAAPWEDAPPSSENSLGISPIESELIRRDVANQIEEHTQGQGRVPGHLARWAEEKLNPKVDWRKKLAGAIRYAVADAAGATDYSYRRPSRRQGKLSLGDVILPSMRQPAPSVVIIADTSASISDQMLAQALAEISGILKSLGQNHGVQVLAVDQAVQSCRKVFRPEQIQLTGGGGTNMVAGLEGAVKLRPLPQLGIVLTDGYTPWPEYAPKGMKVIVVLSGDGLAPEWANVIKINKKIRL